MTGDGIHEVGSYNIVKDDKDVQRVRQGKKIKDNRQGIKNTGLNVRQKGGSAEDHRVP